MNSKIDEWYKFCDELKEVGRIISETSDNAIDENEGFRCFKIIASFYRNVF